MPTTQRVYFDRSTLKPFEEYEIEFSSVLYTRSLQFLRTAQLPGGLELGNSSVICYTQTGAQSALTQGETVSLAVQLGMEV